jgi:(E)-4-hydroxy-3-methylbut-2-enyl-diphosphate synthase
VPEDEMVSTLVEWAELIHEQGIDAAMARADLDKAAREAEKDRAELLAEKGEDANASEQRVELIHKHLDQ